MTEVSLGYIAEAGLAADAANNLLVALEEGGSIGPVTSVLKEHQRALENIIDWAREVNRALSTVDSVDVDDHPI